MLTQTLQDFQFIIVLMMKNVSAPSDIKEHGGIVRESNRTPE